MPTPTHTKNECDYADYLRVNINNLYPMPVCGEGTDLDEYEDMREHALTNAHHFAEEVEDVVRGFDDEDTKEDRRKEIVALAKNWCETKPTAKYFVELYDRFLEGWRPKNFTSPTTPQ